MGSGRQAWFEEQRQLEEQAKEQERVKKARVKLATQPDQLRLDLPIPRGYEMEKAYMALVEDCKNMPGWRNSEHYKAAVRLGVI